MGVAPGTVHALLGENGAGKSTLVKCVAGFAAARRGRDRLIDGREQDIATPVDRARARHRHGLPALHAGAGHDRGREPAARRRPHAGADRLEEGARRAEGVPAHHAVQARPRRDAGSALAAGEKQKLEILKQLYLKPRLLILDEPTSVLTPQEADEVLGLRARSRARAASARC